MALWSIIATWLWLYSAFCGTIILSMVNGLSVIGWITVNLLLAYGVNKARRTQLFDDRLSDKRMREALEKYVKEVNKQDVEN